MSDDVPRDWLRTTIGEVATVVTGKTPPTSKPHLFDGELPFAKPGDLDGPRHLATTDSKISPLAFDFVPRLPAGTVLVSCIGNLGKTAILAREGSCNQQINAVLPTPTALPEFLYAWATTLRPWLDAHSSATTVSIINKGRFLGAPLALPPLNEQRRIVAKLDALQSRSRRAREALDAVPPLLEKLRQSILAAAFRGDLTKDWRAKHKDVEPATELLKRIRIERRRKWEEAELAKMTAKGKRPIDEKWKAKYKEPAPVDTAGLPELPARWCWASAEALCHDISVGHVGPMEHRYVPEGVPFLRSQNVRANRYDPTGLRYIPPDFHAELTKSRLGPGDLVVVRSGAPGTACVIPDELTDANCADLVVVRLVSFVDPHVMAFFMNSAWATGAVLDAQVGVAQQHFNVGAMRTLHMPLMPVPEQRILRARVADALTALSAHSRRALKLTELVSNLEQATLTRAFRGELVPQDPEDVAADVVLARLHSEIRAATNERAATGAKRGGRRGVGAENVG